MFQVNKVYLILFVFHEELDWMLSVSTFHQKKSMAATRFILKHCICKSLPGDFNGLSAIEMKYGSIEDRSIAWVEL